MWTNVLVFLALSALLLWRTAKLEDRTLRLAVAAALVGLAAVDWAAHTGVVPTFWLADVAHPVKAATRLAYNIAIPAESHSLFGLTPRNAALLVFALAMVLRWGGHALAASLAILCIGAVHQTYGGIALLMFVASSALSRPDRLKAWPVRLVLLASLLLFVVRDRTLTSTPAAQLALAALLGLCGLAAFAVVQSRPYGRFRERLLGRFAADEVFIDTAVMLLLCTLLAALALVLGPSADYAHRIYFWSDLAMRSWSFARFPLFVSIALLALQYLSSSSVRIGAGLAAAAAALAFLVLFQLDPAPGRARSNQFQAALAAIQKPVLDLPADEAGIYAHLIQISTGAEADGPVRARMAAVPIQCSRILI
jgi:hypothetical protein